MYRGMTTTLPAPSAAPFIEPGTVVLDYTGRTYVYGGPGRNPRSTRITIHVGQDVRSGIECDPGSVVPLAEFDRASVNAKDERIAAEKDLSQRGAYKWRGEIPGREPEYFKTKRDAVERLSWRLAINDFWASKG